MSRHHAGFARSQAWRRLRMRVFDRDGFRCTKCGKMGRRLECDHIVPRDEGGDDSLDNLRTLCRGCHIEITAERNRVHHVSGQGEWSAALRGRGAVGRPGSV